MPCVSARRLETSGGILGSPLPAFRQCEIKNSQRTARQYVDSVTNAMGRLKLWGDSANSDRRKPSCMQPLKEKKPSCAEQLSFI